MAVARSPSIESNPAQVFPVATRLLEVLSTQTPMPLFPGPSCCKILTVGGAQASLFPKRSPPRVLTRKGEASWAQTGLGSAHHEVMVVVARAPCMESNPAQVLPAANLPTYLIFLKIQCICMNQMKKRM